MNGMSTGGGGRGYGRRRSRNNRGGGGGHHRNHRESSSRQRHEQQHPTSQSPTSEPRVVLLRPSTSSTATTSTVTVPTIATSATITLPETPRSESRNNASPNVTATSRTTSSPVHNLYQVKPYVREDESKKELKTPREPMKLIDFESWSFLDHPSVDYMSNDTQSSTGFKVISVVGTQLSGKSSLLNLIAGNNYFATHEIKSDKCDLLDSLTKGVDLMITSERLFLLDSQALLSPSILDEMIVNSNISITSNDYVSNEADLLYVSSLQLVTFLLYASDCLVITTGYFVDIDLLKLFAMSLKLLSSVGSSTVTAANIIWFLNQKVRQSELDGMKSSLELYFGRGNVVLINANEEELVLSALTTRSEKRRANNSDHLTPAASSVTSERMWLVSCQRFWDSSIKKSSIFNEYMRFDSHRR